MNPEEQSSGSFLSTHIYPEINWQFHAQHNYPCCDSALAIVPAPA